MSEDNRQTMEVLNCSAEQPIDAFCATENALFTGACCNTLTRVTEGTNGLEEVAKCKLPGHAYSLSGNDEKMFALCHTGQVVQLKSEDLTKTGEWKCAYDATCMAWSSVSNQLWIGDKKGKVHVHDTETFAEVHLFEKHRADGKISCCAVSADGTKVATGDSLRNAYVHDAASRETAGHFAHHTAGLVCLSLSADGSHLASVGSDMSFGLADIATKKTTKVANPHAMKVPTHCAILHDGRIATSGYDCAVRVWRTSVE